MLLDPFQTGEPIDIGQAEIEEDEIGGRVTGSPEMAKAVEWAVAAFRAEGVDVHTEKYTLPVTWREGETRLSAHVSAFYNWLQNEGRIPPGGHDRFHGHAYRLYRGNPRRVTADGVLLIGDSAGLAYPQSGEGIRPAIESGLLAAGAIAEAAGEYGRNLRADFARRLGARFGRLQAGQPAASAGKSIFPNAWRASLARRLLATGWFTRHIVINRWFLHANQSPLSPVGSMRPRASGFPA